MKKLLITFILIFSLSIQAQEQFEGSWGTKTSSHTTTIIASEYAILKVFNFSFEEDSYIEEEILNQKDDKFTTKLYNPENGYEVEIKYYFIKDKLYCKFSGDYDGLIEMYRK
jgi:hypothetical protein